MQKEVYQNPMEQYHETLKEPLDFEERKHHLLKCPNCDHFIKADDINIDKTIAKCSNCDHVFNFASTFEHYDGAYSRPDMLIPEGLEVLKLRSELDVKFNWFRASEKKGIGFTVFFTLVWNLILLPFVIGAITSGAWFALLFASVHISIGVSMLMRVFASFINSTHINVTKRYLEIKTKPIPSLFKRNRKIDADQVDQLFVTRYVVSRQNNVANYAHALYAILKDGSKLELIKGMNKKTVQYLEYEIESFLHIKNQPVHGEVR